MNDYRYQLDKGSKKFHCPECGKRRFVRFKDNLTGEYLPKQYGRCDRESKCNYLLNPYLDGYSKQVWEQEKTNSFSNSDTTKLKRKKKASKPEVVFFDTNTFKETLEPTRYSQNDFINYLLQRVDVKTLVEVIKSYRLGTVVNGYRAGATTFPFIDIKNNVRAIQVKQFDENNNTKGTDFLHSIIEKHCTRQSIDLPKWLKSYLEQEKRVSCLFGEHLLPLYSNNPIALVEAPKTAIYGTLYFGLPKNESDLIWLAVYNKSSFSFDKLKVLKGRDVLVFPDLSKDGNTFKEWETKAKGYEKRLKNTSFIFYDLLERLAPKEDRESGNDLADYLIKQDWRQFSKMPQMPQMPRGNNSKKKQAKNFDFEFEDVDCGEFLPTNEPEPLKWDDVIKELESYFSKINLPTEPIQLNQCSKIVNSSLFVENHLNTVKRYNGNYNFEPYLIRLQQLKEILIN